MRSRTIKPTVQDRCLIPATAPLVFPLAVEILSVAVELQLLAVEILELAVELQLLAVEILSVAVPPPSPFHPDSKSTLLGP